MKVEIAAIFALLAMACSNDPAPNPASNSSSDVGTGPDAARENDGGGTADGSSVDMSTPASDSGAGEDGGSIDAGSLPVDLGPSPDPTAGAGEAELVRDGFVFTEGPRWFPTEGVLRFTDIPQATIWEFTEPDVFTEITTASERANGLAFDASGKMLAAQHQARRVAIFDGSTARTLVGDFDGAAFNSPNDLVVRGDGVVYFTDPPYGLGSREREINFNGLFKFDPATSTMTAEWEGDPDSTRPNGVVLSPDESTLYLADTMGSNVLAFDVAADGTLSNEREFVQVEGPDGMAIDVWGNLYVTTRGGVEVFAVDGTSWGLLPVPQRPANCAFGGADGKTLYVTSRTGLYKVRLEVPGIY